MFYNTLFELKILFRILSLLLFLKKDLSLCIYQKVYYMYKAKAYIS